MEDDEEDEDSTKWLREATLCRLGPSNPPLLPLPLPLLAPEDDEEDGVGGADGLILVVLLWVMLLLLIVFTVPEVVVVIVA